MSFIPPEDAMKSLINQLYAEQLLTQHMVFELFINFARSRPDPDEVIERLKGRLQDVANLNFSGDNLRECRDAADNFIENVQRGYDASHRAVE